MSVWSITSSPAAEPLSLSEAKLYLKVSSTSENDLITALIQEARQWVERVTGRALITQTVTEYWDCWPTVPEVRNPRVLSLSVGPVQSVTSVAYVPTNGTPAAYTTWDNTSNANYWLDSVTGGSMPGLPRLLLNPSVSWPDLADYFNSVRVVYVVGYGASGASVPGPLKEAIRRIVGIWYYGRDSRDVDEWEAVSALLSPYKQNR